MKLSTLAFCIWFTISCSSLLFAETTALSGTHPLTQPPLLVGILDNAIDVNHPALAGRIYPGDPECLEQNQMAFQANLRSLQKNEGANTPSEEAAIDFYHATHIAGIVTGVAYEAVLQNDIQNQIKKFGAARMLESYLRDFQNQIQEYRKLSPFASDCPEIDEIENYFNKSLELQKTEKDFRTLFSESFSKFQQATKKCEFFKIKTQIATEPLPLTHLHSTQPILPAQILPLLLRLNAGDYESDLAFYNDKIRKHGVSIVNLSLSLPSAKKYVQTALANSPQVLNRDSEQQRALISQILASYTAVKNLFRKLILQNPEVIFVQAAGNNGENLDNESSGALFQSTLLDSTNIPAFTPWAGLPEPREELPGNLLLVANMESSSLDESNRLHPSSNYGAKTVQVAALGTDVLSLRAGGSPGEQSSEGFLNLTGTSMAAPAVVRTLSQIRRRNPELNAKETIQVFLNEFTVSLKSLEGKIQGARFHVAFELN